MPNNKRQVDESFVVEKKQKKTRYHVHHRQQLWKDWKKRIKSDTFVEPKQEVQKLETVGDWVLIRIVSTQKEGWAPQNMITPMY